MNTHKKRDNGIIGYTWCNFVFTKTSFLSESNKYLHNFTSIFINIKF